MSMLRYGVCSVVALPIHGISRTNRNQFEKQMHLAL